MQIQCRSHISSFPGNGYQVCVVVLWKVITLFLVIKNTEEFIQQKTISGFSESKEMNHGHRNTGSKVL